MNPSHAQPRPAKKPRNKEPQTTTLIPTTKDIIRISEITAELKDLQERQNILLEELRDLTPEKDPPGIDWIYPDPTQQSS